MERWIGSCRRELLDRTLVWNRRHLTMVLREYEDFYNRDRPHRTLELRTRLDQVPQILLWLAAPARVSLCERIISIHRAQF